MQYQEKYQQKRLIGQGSYGKCFLVRHQNENRFYVAKKIAIEEQPKRKLALKQVEVMKRVKNPFVISYKESFLSPEGIIIVMQYCPSNVDGDLKSIIKLCKAQGKTLKESVVKSWCLQLCIGLNYLHTNKLLHRDLKPQNILLSTTNSIKIADFGASKLLDSGLLTHTIVGTYCYMSPEVCKQEPYSYQSDVWSLGCILFQLCNLIQPFYSKYFAELLESIIHLKAREFTGNYSTQLKKFIGGFLKDRNERTNLQSVMTSPFFISILKQEFANSVTKEISATSQLFRTQSSFGVQQEIKEEIEDDKDYVVDNKLDIIATIQSVQNFVQSKHESPHHRRIKTTGIQANPREKVLDQQSMVLAFSATFEQIDLIPQPQHSILPLGSLDTNITIPPKLKYR